MCIDFLMPYLFQQGFQLVTDFIKTPIKTQVAEMLMLEIHQWTGMLIRHLAEHHRFDINLMETVLDLLSKASNSQYQENIKKQVCVHAIIIDNLLCKPTN